MVVGFRAGLQDEGHHRDGECGVIFRIGGAWLCAAVSGQRLQLPLSSVAGSLCARGFVTTKGQWGWV